MGRVKEIQDKEKAPKLNQSAAKRFVRNALWEQAHKKATDDQPKDLTPSSNSGKEYN